MNLRESWESTRFHLETARKLLPSSLKENVEGGSLIEYEGLLSQNELGLAFDELEMIGMANRCPSEFWQELAAAAENMQLFERAARCRAKVG